MKVAPSCGDGTLAPTIEITYTGDSDSAPNEAVSSVSSADSGATMRWDAAAGQYIYNLATNRKAAGQYRVSFMVGGVEATSVTFAIT